MSLFPKSLLFNAYRFLLACFVCCAISSCNSNSSKLVEEYLPRDFDPSALSSEAVDRLDVLYRDLNDNPEQRFAEIAQIFHANGMLREAIQSYEGLIQLNPDSSRWKHLLASILAGYGYADDAELLWLAVIESEPEFIPARIRLGDLYFKSNRLKDAESIYVDCLAIDSSNPYANVGLARLKTQEAKWNEAEDLLKKAAQHSDGKVGRDLLVTVYDALGKKDAADAIRGEAKASGSFVDIVDPWMDDVMDHCYDVTQLLSLGGAAAFRGHHDDAIRILTRVIKQDPANAMGHFQLASIYEQTADLDSAIFHYEKATGLKQNFSDAWIRLSGLHEQKGDKGQSEFVFYKGFDLCPKSPAYQIEHARRLLKNKKYSSAVKALQKSIELRPNEALAYIELSKCYFGMNKIEQGVQQLEKALDVEAGNLTAMTTLCYHAILSGNKSRASDLLTTLEQNPRLDLSSLNQLKEHFRAKFGQ